VGAGGEVAILSSVSATSSASSSAAQHIRFTDPAAGVVATRVRLRPQESGAVAIYAQHVPAEFMAYFLVDSETGELRFPESATLYASEPEPPLVKQNVFSSSGADVGRGGRHRNVLVVLVMLNIVSWGGFCPGRGCV